MEEGMKELVEVSQLFGSDPSFVIAGGGNTSYKNAEKIWIKASGISLATIDENGFVSLSREKLKVVSEKSYSEDALLRENEVKADLHDAIVSPKTLRPSVETSLHDLISYKYIVHTHPTKVNGVMCSQLAEYITEVAFGAAALFIPYTDPGYVLFKKVGEEIRKYADTYGSDPQIIFLENHGVFVGADSTDQIKTIYSSIIQSIDDQLMNTLPSLATTPVSSVLIEKITELHPGYTGFVALGFTSELIETYVKSADDFTKADTSFTPDDIVYCKAHYLFIPGEVDDEALVLSAKSKIEEYFTKFGYLPKVIAVEGQGVITVEENLKSAGNVFEVFENILKISFYTENFGGPKFLNEREIAFIDNWEVENYRRKIAKS
jgi:rhamnose utilization protein RhaD (predicted bifunctional aldolase and dehydrogenase)